MADLKNKYDLIMKKTEDVQPEGDIFEEYMAEPLEVIPKMFNLGLANLAEMPGALGEMFITAFGGDPEKSLLPGPGDIRKRMAKLGLTYKEGEEPNTFLARTFEIAGETVPTLGLGPLLGIATKPLLGMEALGIIGATAGGRALRKTAWGEENPELAEGLGEFFGGFGITNFDVVKDLGMFVLRRTPLGLAARPFRGEAAKERAFDIAAKYMRDPKAAEIELLKPVDLDFPELTVPQKTGDIGAMELGATVGKNVSDVRNLFEKRRSDITNFLKNVPSNVGTGNVVDVFNTEVSKIAKKTQDSISKFRDIADSADINRSIVDNIKDGLKKFRTEETALWNKVKNVSRFKPNSLMETNIDIKSDLTAGAAEGLIDKIITDKLGGTQSLTGKLLNAEKPDVTPKELRQFISGITDKIRELGAQPGNANKIRILTRYKKAGLEDLGRHALITGNKEYLAAVQYSKRLNEIFTEGTLGNILAGVRRDKSAASYLVDEALGTVGKQKGVEAIQKMLDANPENKALIKDIIRNRFFNYTVNEKGYVNPPNARRFLKQYDRYLKIFPDLTEEFKKASIRSSRFEEFPGVKARLDKLSPMQKEYSATTVALDYDPSDDIRKIIDKGKTNTINLKFLKKIKNVVGADNTKKASEGMKNIIINEFIDASLGKRKDPLTLQPFLSGPKLLNNIKKVKSDFVRSGLMNNKDIRRLELIADYAQKIEKDILAKGQKDIVTDVPGYLMNVFSKGIGAFLGRKLNTGTIQVPGYAADFFNKISKALTTDEAHIMLVQAVKDEKVMKELLKGVQNLSQKQQIKMADRLIKMAKGLLPKEFTPIKRYPKAGIVSPIISTSRDEQEIEREPGQEAKDIILKHKQKGK
jgi:hypothetical protein